MIELSVQTRARNELIDITASVQKLVTDSRVESGSVICFIPHTTAAVTINENADPDVRRDILYKLNQVFPQRDEYHHSEGNSDAHIKASLIGFSVQLLIAKGRLVLGTWQGIYFCEFDGPRSRTAIIKITRDA